MHIYFSGIGGAGLSALAHLSLDVGYEVSGSDREKNINTEQLEDRGVAIHSKQSGEEIKKTNSAKKIDWLIVTSALPEDHPEIQWAKGNGLKISKRDELINHIVEDKNLKLLAVSGTHGKTTVTGMAIWVFKKLGIPVSYAIGTNISYGRSAEHDKDSQWFIYEADEFDRNMLKFEPDVSIIPSLDFDHSDTYASIKDYEESFRKFASQSSAIYTWKNVAEKLSPFTLNPLFTSSDGIKRADEAKLFMSEGKIFENVNPKAPHLPGEINRQNGLLAAEALYDVLGASELKDDEDTLYRKIIKALESFPGTGRRFEKISKNIFSDYAHHPVEIKATIGIARDYIDVEGGNNLIVVYQPHQNIRQHEVKEGYEDCFEGVDKLYWLPTYLSRENPELKLLTPEELINYLSKNIEVEISDLNKKLIQKIHKHRQKGDVVVLMGAGSIDPYFRENI